MFKNKKAIYILIPVNILIWGFFIYRIVGALTEEEPLIADSKIAVIKSTDISDNKPYRLKMDYKDPFLKNSPTEHSKRVNQGNPGTVTKIEPRVKVPVKTPTVTAKVVPEIKYLGLIKNTQSGNSTALISFNGQSRIVKPNESLEGVVFKSFDNNELVAFLGKEKLVVKK